MFRSRKIELRSLKKMLRPRNILLRFCKIVGRLYKEV